MSHPDALISPGSLLFIRMRIQTGGGGRSPRHENIVSISVKFCVPADPLVNNPPVSPPPPPSPCFPSFLRLVPVSFDGCVAPSLEYFRRVIGRNVWRFQVRDEIVVRRRKSKSDSVSDDDAEVKGNRKRKAAGQKTEKK